MDERRRANRLKPQGVNSVTTIVTDTMRQDARILDVSSGGMRITFDQPLAGGTVLYCRLKVIPGPGSFFVKGEITRMHQAGGQWEAAVKFHRVSTIPLPGMPSL